MQVKYVITTIIIVCAVLLGTLTIMGPKLNLQFPPIETKALENINKMGFLKDNETLTAYKATSYYSYKSGVVVTDSRIFAFHNDKVLISIPLSKISLIIVKDADLGHQEVIVSAQANGVIIVSLYHKDVAKFLDVLHVNDNIVKHFNKHGIKEAASAMSKIR